jgi:hypothetical protein
MATLPARAGKLLFKGSKLLSKCGCCCTCFAPWCCKPESELYVALKFTGGKRTISNSSGSGKTATTVTLDFTPEAISSTYTIMPSDTNPCATIWDNGVGEMFINPPGPYGSLPSAFFYLNPFLQSWVLRVTRGYSSGSNYRRTGDPSETTVIVNELDQRFVMSWQASVPMPAASDGKYPCNLFSTLDEINMPGNVISGSRYFNYHNTGSWDVPIGMTATFLAPP